MDRYSIRYYGWSSLAIETPQWRLLFDPFYRNYCNVQWFSAQELCPARYIAVTHGHEEHFLDTPELSRLTGARVFGPDAVIRFLRRRNGLDPNQLQALNAGQSTKTEDFRLDAFHWQHRDVNLISSVAKSLLQGNFTQLAWAWHSATQAPFWAPYTGYRITLPDGTAILNYNEGFNVKMTEAEITALAAEGKTDVLLGGMQLDFMKDLERGVKALAPQAILLYPPHDKLHAMMGVKTRPWSEFEAAARRAAPQASVVLLEPGTQVDFPGAVVSRFKQVAVSHPEVTA